MASPTEKWLIVKLADIGDLVTITPALGLLRAARPQAAIHVLTTGHSAEILPEPLVDHVITFDKFAFDRSVGLLRPANLQSGLALTRALRREHYDRVLILHHLTTRFGAWKYAVLALVSGAPARIGLDNGRGWFLTGRVTDRGFGAEHEAAYWLRVTDATLGTSNAPYTPDRFPLAIRITAADRRWAAEHLPSLPEPTVVLHTGSGGYSPARRWSPEGFAALADGLHESLQARIVLVGGEQDGSSQALAAMCHAPLSLVGQTTLGQLGAVLERSDLFIGADSGVMHLACAAGTRVLALFGPSNAAAWGPWSPRGHVLSSDPLCSPCSYVMSTVGQRDGCPARTCMRMITPESVIRRTQEVLAGNGATAAPAVAETEQAASERVRILGIPLDPISWDDLRATLRSWIASERPRQICTVNPEFIMVAQRDVNFFTILNRADLCAADGQGLLWAARWLGTPLPARITGSDGVPLIAGWAAAEGWRLYLLGAAEGVAQQAAHRLQATHPGLQIVGTCAGSPAPEEEDAIVARINASGADILFVAYGAPRQDKWIARNLPRLQVKVAMGVGGSLDFIAGVQKRAPASWQRLGLEWLYRLIQEPWRWKRMTRLPRFVLAVLRRGSAGPVGLVGPRQRPPA